MNAESTDLTEEQIKSIRESFERYDVKHCGFLPVERLGDIMRGLGHRLDQDELAELARDVDSDGDGVISWEEFLVLMAAKVKEQQETAFYKTLFRMLDKKKRGFIPCDDLRYIVQGMASEVKLSQDDVDDIIAHVDEDGNGEVSFEEFYKLMTTE